MTRRHVSVMVGIGLLLVGSLLAACQTPVAPTKEPARPTPVQQSSGPGQSAIQLAWQDSKHGKTFVEGENNTCARCHSPMNWTPTDPADMPATCASCKFTVKTPKPALQSDWQSVTCEVCHKVENKTLTSEVTWLNAAVAQFDSSQSPYEAVASSGELCRKCHANTAGLHYGRDLGTGAHSTFSCTKCHDTHTLTASCTVSGCHPSGAKPENPTAGHDAAHAKVSCPVCHDATALKAGPVSGQTTWSSFWPTTAQGEAKPTPYVSHNLQRKVDCARCHYASNPWGLNTYS